MKWRPGVGGGGGGKREAEAEERKTEREGSAFEIFVQKLFPPTLSACNSNLTF